MSEINFKALGDHVIILAPDMSETVRGY